MINFTNKDNLEKFVADNIKAYNEKSSQFAHKKLTEEIKKSSSPNNIINFTNTDFEEYLSEKFTKLLSSNKKQSLDDELNNLSGCKKDIQNKLSTIANREILSYKDLADYYTSSILNKIKNVLKNDKYTKKIMTTILSYADFADIPESEKKNLEYQNEFIKETLSNALDSTLFLALSNGFTSNQINHNNGVKNANEGDSAQFLFLARAILAGFNCSNVDVRSSKYDAIIDYDGVLLKVQIKGVSSNGTKTPSLKLKDRDRGGQGIDTNSARNKGKFFSSEDFDLLVAVEKKFGICYLIPATVVDCWVKKGKKSISITKLQDFMENWENISVTAKALTDESSEQH